MIVHICILFLAAYALVNPACATPTSKVTTVADPCYRGQFTSCVIPLMLQESCARAQRACSFRCQCRATPAHFCTRVGKGGNYICCQIWESPTVMERQTLGGNINSSPDINALTLNMPTGRFMHCFGSESNHVTCRYEAAKFSKGHFKKNKKKNKDHSSFKLNLIC